MFGYICLPKSKTIIYNITMKKSRKIVALLSALMLLPAVMTGVKQRSKYQNAISTFRCRIKLTALG